MPHPSPPLAAITGARGWLGGCVKRQFGEGGWQTIGLVRKPAGDERAFNLGEEVPPATLAGAQALVHCAYDFAVRDWSGIEEVNVRGTERLFQAAAQAGVPKLVYISTMSAFPGAQSLYGKAKLAAEAIAARHGALIVRPGLITGDVPGGMFGNLVQQVAKSRLVPVIAGEAVLYAVHERDLCELIYRYCQGEFPIPAQPITAAHPEPWPFRQLLQELARRAGKQPAFVSVPWRFVWLGLRAAETLGLRLAFRSDSVLSLANQNPAPDFANGASVGFHPQPF